ncbi:MFS transporter [Hoylesella timonensis]|uniref:Lysosomal dipeptide transporter MFSD1 n=1 Tax=Hoylesella timonensis TaxID=386414 RepID=A0A2K0XN80_9BACT|nr:MFS transporter [Hoylesella timonensis]PMC10919.1 MFS transporter [Hoylesella timonensis]PNP95995.1 MFS transporter [Hoylesella timonensis]
MVETFQKKLSDSPAWRWTALVLLASAMFFAYIFVDILSPLQEFLQTQHGWDPIAYGRFAGSEPFLNVFVFFLIFAGIILDKMGVRFTAILSGTVMVVGASINYYALTEGFDASSIKVWFDNNLNLPLAAWNITPFYDGMPASAKLSAIGFMIFGCGAEMAGITVSRGIVKWFKGKEMALAMGIEMAIARVGVAVVVIASPAIASIKPINVSRPLAYELLLLIIGLICFIVYGFMDKKLDAQGVEEEKDDPFKVSDIGKILSLKMFWIVALLCVLYYSAIFPFQKYAINMLQCNLQFSAEQAGLVFFVFPLGAAAVTPFLGNFLDRKGKGATMLIIGAMLMIICHLIFAFVVPATQSVIITYAAIILLGISFSLVPAALWPSVPKLIDDKLIGSAYALIFWIQNIGLYAFPMIIGSVLRSSNPGVTDPLKYDYTAPMLVFVSLGVIALILGFLLKALDKKKGYGLELPNIQK